MPPRRRRSNAGTDAETLSAVATAADDLAVKAGCRFDPERADFACQWMETYLRLYEGDQAGQVLTLLPCWRDFFRALYGWVRWSAEWECWVRRFTHASFWGAKKNGKALCLETEVPTPTGFRRFGDLDTGDELFDETGAVCRVTGRTEVWAERPCYEVEFSDGTKVTADAEHLWRVESFKAAYRPRLLTTRELAESVDVTNGRGEAWAKNHRVPVAGAVQTSEASLPIPPYTLGAWLGDGDSDCNRLTSEDDEVLAGVAADGFEVHKQTAYRGNAGRFRIGGGRSGLMPQLRSAGVLKSKHIPPAYLFASEGQRLDLLRGLMDTDGTVSKAGQCSFTATNPRLAADVRTLVASLGWKPSTRVKTARCQTGAEATAYEVQFWATADRPCFTIQRKLARLRPARAGRTRAMSRQVVAVRPVASVPVRCISVDSPSRMFLVTRSFVATHNSPMAAAHNLYLLCGDNEPGQKVYQAAANGEQARIAQMHAVNMVRQSPELNADCKINSQTLLVAHLPTNSQLMILTGDDSRGAKAKEGLNGSVTYDEMHVVNREIEERTSRAGISRKEPINASFSTAGDDPSSVGYQRAAYGRQVNSGERKDIHFLHVEYTAPEKVKEADIEDRLEDLGRMANPAWGKLVKPTEFRADWQRSKGSPREVARFKQYRLNLWVGSTNQWLDAAGWERGGAEFTLDDLAGRDCYAALDLSRTRDMTAFVLVFPEADGEGVTVWPMFWLPEQSARERDHLFPYRSWAKDGHLTLTAGGVVDYSQVKAEVRAAVREHRLNLLKWFYDPHYAEELTQQLAEGETMGGEVEEGIGGERVAFPQTITHMTGPAKEFERRVSAGLVRHPNNAVMTWQVGHCEAKTDLNQNVRPVKPHPSSGKSVDGVVAGVMCFAELMAQKESFYSPTVFTV